jgi:hypothetical protein
MKEDRFGSGTKTASTPSERNTSRRLPSGQGHPNRVEIISGQRQESRKKSAPFTPVPGQGPIAAGRRFAVPSYLAPIRPVFREPRPRVPLWNPDDASEVPQPDNSLAFSGIPSIECVSRRLCRLGGNGALFFQSRNAHGIHPDHGRGGRQLRVGSAKSAGEGVFCLRRRGRDPRAAPALAPEYLGCSRQRAPWCSRNFDPRAAGSYDRSWTFFTSGTQQLVSGHPGGRARDVKGRRLSRPCQASTVPVHRLAACRRAGGNFVDALAVRGISEAALPRQRLRLTYPAS